MEDLPGSSFMTMGAMVLLLAGSCVTRWLVVKAEVDAAKLKNRFEAGMDKMSFAVDFRLPPRC